MATQLPNNFRASTTQTIHRRIERPPGSLHRGSLNESGRSVKEYSYCLIEYHHILWHEEKIYSLRSATVVTDVRGICLPQDGQRHMTFFARPCL